MIQNWAQNNRLRSSFSPTGIPGLALWLDASDAATITLDGSNNVSQWSDKSGNARNAAQASTTLRPGYLTSGINGRPALVGDGVDDLMTWPAFASGTNHNFYIVAAYDTGIARLPFLSGLVFGGGVACMNNRMGDTSSNPAIGMQISGVTSFDLQAAGQANNIKSGIPFVMSLYRNAGTYKAKWTYASLVNVGTFTGGPATNATGTNVIFSGTGGSASFRIAELVCYTKDLSAGEEASLSAYFLSRYGVGI